MNVIRNAAAFTVGDLPLWDVVIDFETRTVDVEQFFLSDRDLPACIISGKDRILGVLSRKSLMTALSKPFGRDVFIKRPVSQLVEAIDTKPVILPAETTIATALKLAMSRRDEQRYDPVLVDQAPAGLRLLEVNTLMTAQASLLEQALCAKDALIEEVRRTESELRHTLDAQKQLARELASAKEVAQHQATHDSLTGLPNRRLFLEALEAALLRHQQDPAQDCAVLFIDLDRFKIVNDSLGHLAGNELLKEVARRLNQLIRKRTDTQYAQAGKARPADMVARLSGDEFTVLLTGQESPKAAEAFADRAQAALGEAVSIGSEEAYISASIGIVASLAGYVDTEAVLRDSDIAMYRAKNFGKARAALFEPSMHTQAETRLHMENQLHQALVKQEFELHYQPTIALPGRAIAGLEALVRWRSPMGLIEAEAFIGLAEETGLILPLGKWIFHESLETVRRWHLTLPGRPPVPICVNLSARQFAQEDLVESLAEPILHSGIDPGKVTIELTESCTMIAPERSVRVFEQLKALGVRLCIDNFGAGNSSLSYLHRLPIDMLKIDRAFTAQMGTHPHSEKVINVILGLAGSLGFATIVKGVETARQVEFLERSGVKFAQGAYFTKPLSKAEAETILRDPAPFEVSA